MGNNISHRAKNIDLFKAILVVIMVLGHVLQFIIESKKMLDVISTYANLTSFCGFLFCFGYSTHVAYLTKDFCQIKKKLLKNIARLLIAFYISGISYELVIAKNYDIFNYIKIIALLKLPGYSEFLAAFVILNILIFIFFRFLKKATNSKKVLAICSIVSVLSTFIPYEKISFPWANLLIGTLEVSFPILQYLSLFFAGIYFAKYKPKFNIKVFFVTIICFVFYLITYKIEKFSGRFPPKIGFIIGSYMFLYIYYYLTLYNVNKFSEVKVIDWIAFIRKRYIIIFINKQYNNIYSI